MSEAQQEQPSVTEYPYLVKRYDGPIVQASGFSPAWREKTRSTGTLGSFKVVEHAGYDKTAVVLRVWQGALRANGGKISSVSSAHVPYTAAGLKKVVRRLRPQEAEQIAEVDAEIRRLNRLISEQRRRREELVKTAWANGHVVRLTEVRPQEKQGWEQ